MRIYNEDDKSSYKSILIMLTPKEVQELIAWLHALSEEYDHVHVNDEDFSHEITIGLYTPRNLHTLSKEIIQLIEHEE